MISFFVHFTANVKSLCSSSRLSDRHAFIKRVLNRADVEVLSSLTVT